MTTESRSIVEMITEQHATIRQLFADLEAAAPDERGEAFEPLVRLLAVHETAEEEIVYPIVNQLGDDAKAIVDARKHEEDAAKKALADLEDMDTASAEFAAALALFRGDVQAHASSEEAEILPLLATMDAERLEIIGKWFAAAEAMAPTHAHRMAPESAIGNLIVGPFVSMVDRVRDAIRDAGRR
ncbi:hemerythrin domain-containing protein [Desertimonas flava]|uniref:hemerythrin domain-containing protein n=1 Tax=Desertimonas flava TaxID=2064846 RepID=UPI000E35655E|nr:hemerythrin domain-containing protein [Desertimonas flava]